MVLVDLDLRRPSLHRFFDLPGNTTGLTQIAIGDATLDESLMPIEISDGGDLLDGVAGRARPLSLIGGSLHVLTAGASPPNPGEFVGSHALERILIELQTRFDTVLIDSPPALRVVDAIALSSKVDAMVVVANWPANRQEHWDALLRARAIENQCFMIGVNRTGHADDLSYIGGSTDNSVLELVLGYNGLGRLTGSDGNPGGGGGSGFGGATGISRLFSSEMGYEISWLLHDTRYEISVLNPERRSRGVASVELDGARADAGAIPLVEDGGVHQVRVVLGHA